jgi:hypothetical protein
MIGSLKFSDMPNEFEYKRIQKELAKIDEMITSVLKGQLSFVDSETSISNISCERVDGYVPSSHNKGGKEVSGMVLSMASAVDNCSNSEANEKMNNISNETYNDAIETFFNENKEKLNIESKQELETLLNEDEALQNSFHEHLDSSSEDEAVMFKVRILYTGIEDEKMSFIVDAQVNWEFPYFRDNKGCSAFISTEFSVKNSEDFGKEVENQISIVTRLFN